ncbi:hypothetical protein A9Q92_05730 [Methylophaga sp. 42_8_T64]|nr:hypothetical protein A9Q92_05730 [Methylophaga sp. 42_8_T64]
MFKPVIELLNNRFKNLKTRQKILFGFSVPLLLMVAIAGVTYQSIQESDETLEWVTHTQEVIAAGNDLKKLMVDMETGERGFLITGKDKFLEPFNDAKGVWSDKVVEYKNLVADNPEQVTKLDEIDQLQQQWQQQAAEIEIAQRRSVPESDKSLTHMQTVLRKKVGKSILDEARLLIDDLTASLELANNQRAVNLLLSLSTDIVEQETGQRGYLITAEDSFLQPYREGQDDFNANMIELRRLIEGGIDRQRVLTQIDEVETLTQKWRNEAAEPEITLRDEVLSGTADYHIIEQRLADAHGKGILDDLRESLYQLEQQFIKAEIKSGQSLVIAIAKDMVDQETGQRGYLITGKQEFLQPYENGSKNLIRHFTELRALVNNASDKESVFKQLDVLRSKVKLWHNKAAKPEINSRREIFETGASTIEFLQATLSRGDGKDLLDEMRVILTRIETRFNQANKPYGSNLVLRIAKAMVDQETGERGFLITGEDEFLQPYHQGQKDFDQAILDLRILLERNLPENSLTENDIRDLRDDVLAVQALGKQWLEQAAKPEIAARRKINRGSVQTLEYIQKVLVRGAGKNILDEMRTMIVDLNQTFVEANHLTASHHVLALKKAIVDQETGQRGFLITGDEEFLEPFNSGLASFRSTVPKLKLLISNYYTFSDVHADINAIETLSIKWRQEAAEPEIELRRQVNAGEHEISIIEERLSVGLGKGLLDKLRHKLIRLNQDFVLAEAEFGQQLLTAIAKDMVDQETGQRGFLITGKDNFLQPFVEGKENLDLHLQQLRDYVDAGFDKAATLNKVEQIWRKAEEWQQVAAIPEIDIRRDINQRGASMNDVTVLIENETGKNLVDAIRAELATFIAVEQGLLISREQQAKAAATRTTYTIFIGTGLAILIALILALMVSNTLVNRLKLLLAGTQKVIDGHFDETLDVDSEDEIGQLTGSFNDMTKALMLSSTQMKTLLEEAESNADSLRAQQDLLEQSNQELEEQTQALKASEEELKAQSEELHQSNEELREKSNFLVQQKMEIEKQNRAIEESRQDIIVKAQELEISSKYKSEFLANMSHELRTPLNSLLILSKSLADNRPGNLNDDQIESASTVYEGGQELLSLINDILDLSKVEAGKLSIHIDKVNLDEMKTSLGNKFKPLIEQKNLELILDSDDGVPEFITTDNQRAQQIVKNLLSNASKFTTKGSITVSIHAPASDINFSHSELTASDAIGISVIDTGIGIPEDKQREIFEAFQQADGSTSRRYGGTGLGLTISRELARLLGGEIQLQSEEGVGSTFTLYLPLDGQAIIEKIQQVPDRRKKQVIPHVEDKPKAMKTKPAEAQTVAEVDTIFLPDDRDVIKPNDKILLIVEDDKAFAKILLQLGRDKGYKCLTAGDGFSGLFLANKFQPSGIILDLGLPDIDGLAVLDQLKHELNTRHIPVHVMSGRDARKASLHAGAMEFLQKPISSDNISDSLNKIEQLLTNAIKKVLVVEDDDKNRKAVVKLIKNKHINVDAVADGQSAIDTLSSEQFDCIILDLNLPDMTGFEVLQALEKQKDTTLPPVIIHTGRDLSEDEYKNLNQYTDSIVIKGAASPERLFDEVSLFLHSVTATMPAKQQELIQMLHQPDQALQNKRILLVDDDVRNTFALSKELRERGMEVILADNGQMALEQLEANEGVDLVLMDIMMPVMDGHEAMKKIREQDQYKDLPVIALTALAMSEDRAKCIKSGANDYLAKPLDMDKLLSMMRIWLFNSLDSDRRADGRPWDDDNNETGTAADDDKSLAD